MTMLQDLEKFIIPVQQLNDDGCPTASIAVLDSGKISSHVITAGKENVDTVYQACSMSKAITGFAVAKMVDMGKISWQTKAIDHLAQPIVECLAGTQNRRLLELVTVSMLLSHTSGISQGGFPGFTDNFPTALDVVAGRSPARTPKIIFDSFPGSQLQYSGGGFVLLQLVMEDIMGMPFPQLMHDVVFEPLSMKRSSFHELSSNETNFTKAHFNGYTATEPGYHRFLELAAAGLWTTPTDLLKAISAVQTSGKVEGGFLKCETARQMLTKAQTSEESGGFGMGWGVTKDYFGHAGGNDPGYTGYFLGNHWDQSSEHGTYGIAVMMNGHYWRFRRTVARVISAIFFMKGWPRYEELPCSFGEDDFAPYAAPAGTEVGDAWRSWVGKWEQGWEIIDSDGPSLVQGSKMISRLRPAAAPVAVSSAGREETIFVVDGIRTGLRLTWDGEDQVIEILNDVPRTLKRSIDG